MKKKILKAQIIQTIFTGTMLIVAFLEYRGIIKTEKRITGFYVLASLCYWVLIVSVFAVIVYRNEKTMHRNKKTIHRNRQIEKKLGIFLISITIEILLISVFSSIVDDRVDKMEFSKHCNKTTAKVYNVTRDIIDTYPVPGHRYAYSVTFDYYIIYDADGETINSQFYTHNSRI